MASNYNIIKATLWITLIILRKSVQENSQQ